ncbi:MAG: RNA polymerase factor sigma-54 [Pseudodesulfovibrio sp.]|jgi:RNA polymerase sigma-54 factor|uniref:RNA polymerase RpoN-/SigL-like sigma 54 subunit n=1 Tax=Pseudodesulfovibrio indicus TaxID=1716143 RepID=A0A126QNV3_9BACT|nr:RNA polymerase factor sigma-54 [Pseudodesulfovibrio indicus]AMK11723.1 RNA polymerase sigma-54 factor [Pseudodesulfovibrio indicus]TDT88257.1 RNA polymerase RpoN-/SigL-like sigma 54 subunit [Pseudodesulfovibrio indicus]
MGLELRQQLKLTQQLVMTPQLQQAIKLLQLSRLELLETVQQELLENPFLDETEPEVEPQETPDPREVLTEAQAEEELVRTADWENYLGEFSSTSKQALSRDSEIPEEGMSFEARLASKPSLEGHVTWQMRLSDFTEHEVAIGEVILGNIDSNGYLQASMEELTSMIQATDEEVESVLMRIQRLDPVGVAARSPQECLLVQMEVLGYDDPTLVSLVRDHLEDLEKNRYKPLARKFKITMEELKDYLDTIQTLDPMPGASFSSTEPHYVSPDVFVYKYGEDFVIILNEDGLPRLQMNSFYMDSMKGAADKEKEYFQEKMRSAAWLMKSLYQRQRTLYKVVESIVGFQRGFFEEGVTKLKPLILKEVAEDIEMHESTVSRITTNKYVSTPHGIYELKFFFNSALDLNDGSQVGSESVKALIKQMIADEDTKKPLSDERIGEILKEKLDVNIARRTVAKYRSAMGIASSSKRKQYF